jgi:hypothetical protein
MKSEATDAAVDEQQSFVVVSGQAEKKSSAKASRAKSLKQPTFEERKREASKPIYLVRYE